MSDFDGIVASLRLTHPDQYDEYDRLRAEAELRYSLVIPIYLLIGICAVTFTPWSLLALPLALAANWTR